jgi:galactose mutarotase-like enzyme
MQRDDDRIVLKNGALRVVLLPGSGGRIESLQGGRLEFLLQPSNSIDQRKPYEEMISGMRFQDGACSGMDECLPTVATSSDGMLGLAVPDHGDFWAIPWTILEPASSCSVTIAAVGASRPLRFTKRLEVHPTSLRIDYTVQNLSAKRIDYLYACHPLFAIDPGDRIVLPTEAAPLRVESSGHERLGVQGDSISWPIAQGAAGPIDLSLALHPGADTADMLYTGRLISGRCGLFRSAMSRGIVLHFDPAHLPYVGLWLCYGGWPDNSEHRQFAVALEPAVAARGSLEDAVRDGVAPALAPYETHAWTIEFHIAGLAGAISEEAFAQTIASGVASSI